MESLYHLTSLHVVVVMLTLMILAAEGGFRRGRVRALRGNSGLTSARAAVKGAMLAMVGLLLALSFSMAASRYEMRYEVVIKESNSIGTVWLRTGFLPEGPRAEARSTLRRLVDARMVHRAMMTDLAGFYRTEAEVDRIQNEFWNIVERAFNSSSEPVRLTSLIQATNEMIDVSAERKAAAWNHVPAAVIFALILCMVIASFLVGHSSGEAGHRDWLMWCLFLGLIAVVFYVMLDLDRPARGLIRLNPAPLLDLKAQIAAEKSP